MTLNINNLANALRNAFEMTQDVTEIDANDGTETVTIETFKPPLDKMETLATEIINHFKNNGDIINVNTAVNTTVAVTTPAGPGTGTGTGNGIQTGFGKIQ